ncbi:MAG: hypothetical protein G01um101420_194 [Parcubacteria group bacterium Gr01-1014_20]|nr:MAG: hypothetical protein G01um101420_194 [Parcubacteria group bacterium Gr01-1014_20]
MIESLIVVALILFFGTIALLNLGPRKNTKEFASTVEKIVHIFEMTRNKAVNFEGGDRWLVALRSSACPTTYGPLPAETAGLAIYFSSAPNSNGVFDSFYALPVSVAYDESVTFWSISCPTAKHIYFAGLTGQPSESNYMPYLKIYMISDPRVSSTISVSTSTGLVSYTTSSLWSF